MELTFPHFMEHFASGKGMPIEMRRGQRLMNLLSQYRPGLYAYMSGTGRDPFYDDFKVDTAIVFIAKNWDDFD